MSVAALFGGFHHLRFESKLASAVAGGLAARTSVLMCVSWLLLHVHGELVVAIARHSFRVWVAALITAGAVTLVVSTHLARDYYGLLVQSVVCSWPDLSRGQCCVSAGCKIVPSSPCVWA
jgi:hypothetical protein